MDAILTWTDRQCTLPGRAGLRMDTWASNTALIGFYQRRGFRLVAEPRLGADPCLAHTTMERIRATGPIVRRNSIRPLFGRDLRIGVVA